MHDSPPQRLAEELAFLAEEFHVVIKVVDVAAEDGFEGDEAALVVDALAGEGFGGETAEELSGVEAILLEKVGDEAEVHALVEAALGEGGFVVGDEEGAILGHDPFHAVRRDEIAVHGVDDDLADAPGVGDGEGVEIGIGEALDRASEGGGSGGVGVDELGGHGEVPRGEWSDGM